MLHFDAIEAYLDNYYPGVGPLLYIAFRVYSKDPNSLLVFLEQEHEDQIEYNGKSISLNQFRGYKNLISFEIMSDFDSWAWYEYTDEGLFIFVCIMSPDIKILENASLRLFTCSCWNMQTGRSENGTIEVGIPALISQDEY